jgi:peptidoglycan/xylan/chitin deacetylase (PgdA/CDA1 family)
MRLQPYPILLAYHRVSSEAATDTPTITPDAFERQIAYVSKRSRVLTCVEAVRLWLNTGMWPRDTCVITFDDGEISVHDTAWPILQKYDAPATVFTISDHINTTNFMTGQHVRVLAEHGIEIGGHTINHAYLPRQSAEEVERQLRESKIKLEEYAGRPIETMSYPGGGFSAAIARSVEAVGYLAACTTNRVLERGHPGIAQYAIRRIKMTGRTTASWALWAKLSGFYDSFRALQPSH